MTRGMGIFAGALAVLAIGFAAVWFGGARPEPEPARPARPAVPAPGPTDPDVVGLPALFPEGLDHPQSNLDMDAYFAAYGSREITNPATDRIREDVEAQLTEELKGKEVTWEGYVARIQDAPSGRVMVMVTLRPNATAEAAMFHFSAAWSDHIHAYEKGEHVRVVGVYDKLLGVFPSLRAKSIEPIENG